MKIAVSGKGGVGKTTICAFLAKTLADRGQRVLAIDADPQGHLAAALGIPKQKKITPISEMKGLIEERTGAEPGSMGTFFKLNPTVDDIPDKLSVSKDNIRLLVMGGIKKGGGGCACPESVLLKALVQHLILFRDEAVVMDMEAGTEHIGRATAKGVDRLITVVEPGRRSVDTAKDIKRLAQEIGLINVSAVGNKIRGKGDESLLRENMPEFDFLGFIPLDEEVIEADLRGLSPLGKSDKIALAINDLVDRLLKAS